jgi:hypothetical protein
MSEFFPIPTLYSGKIYFLADGRDLGQSHVKNAVGGSKNIHLTAEGSSVVIKAISSQSVEKFSFLITL